MDRSDFSIVAALQGKYPSRELTAMCDKHGEYAETAYLDAVGEVIGKRGWCKRCSELQEQARAEEERQERYKNRYQYARIPPRFASCEFGNYEPTENSGHLATLRDYAVRWPEQLKTGESLLLLGDIGTGKTHLSVSVLKEIMRKGHPTRYLTVMELLREVRAAWRKKGEHTEQQIIDEFGGIDLLVLDEVGVQYGSDSERVTLFDVLNERYEHVRPTIVAGNVSVADLQKFLDARCVDRLRENGGRALVFKGSSYRKSPPQQQGSNQ